MSDYGAVTDALQKGADPAMLCATCPWDRNCITPPTLTRQEIDDRLAKATAEDERRDAEAIAAGKPGSMPMGSILTALTYAGRDTSSQVCPVFGLRLRSGAGRKIADRVRDWMQKWDDQS